MNSRLTALITFQQSAVVPVATRFTRTLPVMDLDILQWPAMAASVVAAWWVGSQQPDRRKLGFWIFVLSNGLWTVWGLQAHAYALIVLQFILFALNLRGLKKNKDAMH